MGDNRQSIRYYPRDLESACKNKSKSGCSGAATRRCVNNGSDNTGNRLGPLIALLGHTGNFNLGDEAITQSVIENLKERMPDARFCFFTINPDDSEKRYGYPAHPLRPAGPNTVSSVLYRNWQGVRFGEGSDNALSPLFERDGWQYTQVEWRPTFKQQIRSLLVLALKLPAMLLNERKFNRETASKLEDVDLLVFTGSNQFLDNYGGPWAFPYTLLRWTKLATRLRKPLAFASVGAGPIYAHDSMKKLRNAVELASYVSVRDKPSRDLMLQGGCQEPIHVLPDLAFSLKTPPPSNGRIVDTNRPIIGINPMPVYSPAYWYVGDERVYQSYVQALTEFVAHLAIEEYPFFFFTTQARDQLVIDDVFENISGLLTHPLRNAKAEEYTRNSKTVDELSVVLQSVDIVVATRFHGTVLGLLAGKPVMGMCYYRKAGDLLDDFGLDEYVMQLENLDADDMIRRLGNMKLNYEAHCETIRERLVEYRLKLDEQFDALGRLIKPNK